MISWYSVTASLTTLLSVSIADALDLHCNAEGKHEILHVCRSELRQYADLEQQLFGF
jgi:hypothetical protein